MALLRASLRTRLVESCGAAASTMAKLRPQGAAIPQACLLQQTRPAISVEVPHGNVDRAWRNLQRKLREEHFMEAANARKYYVEPSERRKLQASASAKRFRDKEFKEMLQWVMRRKSRGF